MSSANDFLINKIYGSPTMPKDFSELCWYIQLQLQYCYSNVKSEFVTKYLSQGYWGFLYLLRDYIFISALSFNAIKLFRIVYGYGPIKSISFLFHAILLRFFKLFLSLPPIRSKLDKELGKTIEKINTSVILNDEKLLQFPSLPSQGLSEDDILQELDKLQDLKHSEWDKGRVSGAVYHGGNDLLDLQSIAYKKYSIANQLHPDVFPGVRKMESEVVSMVLKLFNAPESACGSSTSGGTESLLLTGLAARQYGRINKNITEPEVIAPVTVHAGIEKACFYFGMKLHKVDLDPITYKVDLKKVKRLINSNTVLLVGSAPNYPHGIIDDIEGLSKLALKYDIPLHVDACLGSFIVSFLEKSKVHETVPLFDFRLKGVTSISCDTHKYGFAPKGSSIIMYRSKDLRKCQYYVSSDWVGGMYGSPTLAGSRPGALMVGCWATLVRIGEEGYTQFCKDIVSVSMKFKDAIKTDSVLSKHLEVIGDPIGSVVAFRSRSKNVSIYQVGDLLANKGWHFASLQNPAALHFAFTKLTIPVIDELISDLIECLQVAVTSDEVSDSDTAAIYGVAGSVSTVGVADRIIEAFLDALYKL